MLSFFTQNLSTILVSAVIVAIIVLIIANMVRDRKKARASGGCTSCSGCSMSSICHKK